MTPITAFVEVEGKYFSYTGEIPVPEGAVVYDKTKLGTMDLEEINKLYSEVVGVTKSFKSLGVAVPSILYQANRLAQFGVSPTEKPSKTTTVTATQSNRGSRVSEVTLNLSAKVEDLVPVGLAGLKFLDLVTAYAGSIPTSTIKIEDACRASGLGDASVLRHLKKAAETNVVTLA